MKLSNERPQEPRPAPITSAVIGVTDVRDSVMREEYVP